MQVENFQKLMDTVAQIDEQGRKAVKATVRDVKARAPSWIAQEVTSVYNIKKGEITPSGKNSGKPKKMAGSVKSFDGTKIAVLTALQLTDEYDKLKQDYDELVELLDEK